jgi:FtsP/CotA-like multicopper oxidase with cupredoxin domain
MPTLADSRPITIPPLGRRQFLAGAGATGLSLAGAFPTVAQTPPKVDYTIRIAPVSVELAPDKVIKTYGYNGVVPGPVLRLKEGQQVSITVVNDTDIDDIIHWHGLFVPSEVDGAMEEGSPMVPAHGGSKVYTFTPKPTGTRWYHSHDVAGTDLTRSTYAGHYGFLIVEPTSGSRTLRPRSTARRAPLGGPMGQYAGHAQRATARQRA